MDYGSLIQQAWSITWRHRFLWLLGMFAGSIMTTCNPASSFNYSFGAPGATGAMTPREPAPPGPFGQAQFEDFAVEAARWFTENAGLIVAGILLLVLLGLAFLIVNTVAQGGLAHATADLARGRPTRAGEAWGAGFHLFWRYVGLWLILIVIGIVIAIFFGIIAGIGVALGAAADSGSRTAIIVIGALLGMLAFLLAIAIGIPFGIVVTYAQRAIAIDDSGPIAALRAGYHVLRGNLGTSLIVWLISLALGIGAAIVIAVAMGILLVMLGMVGWIVYAAVGLTAGFIVYAVVAALAFIAVLWVVAGIANTYLWSYWTIAYLRLRGEMPPLETAV